MRKGTIKTEKWLTGLSWALALTGLVACDGGSRDSQTSEAWNARNDPAKLGIQIDMPFEQLPAQGYLPADKYPWSGHYWPHNHGGIAHRWQYAPGPAIVTQPTVDHPFYYRPLTQGEVARLSSTELNRLSPSEKYDLYMGRLDFPLTHAELQRTLRGTDGRDIPGWFGICHGWAPASFLEPVPGNQATVRLRDGRSMTFYASDLHALISRLYGTYPTKKTFVGGRCNDREVQIDASGRVTQAVCRDVNPGTLHLALAEYLGRRKQPILADIEPGAPVWNFPVIDYTSSRSPLRPMSASDPLAAHRAPGTMYLVDVDLTLYMVYGVKPSTVQKQPRIGTKKFAYTLELDANRRVVGGEWRSKERPDFLWQVSTKPEGEHAGLDYAAVTKLLDLSRQGSVVTPPPITQRPRLVVQHWMTAYVDYYNGNVTVWGRVQGQGKFRIRLVALNGTQGWLLGEWMATGDMPFQVAGRYPRFATRFVLQVFDEHGRQMLDRGFHPR